VGVIVGVNVGVILGVGVDPTSKSMICPLNCKIEPLCVIIILII
jgi:TctA family transporter